MFVDHCVLNFLFSSVMPRFTVMMLIYQPTVASSLMEYL